MHGVVMEEEIQDKTEAIKNNSFQVTMLIGGAVIAVLAQWVRGFAYLELRWVTNIFFVIGIALFLFGAWTIDNNRMPKWVEKGVNGVSGWFHISPTRLIYLFFSICLVVIRHTCGWIRSENVESAGSHVLLGRGNFPRNCSSLGTETSKDHHFAAHSDLVSGHLFGGTGFAGIQYDLYPGGTIR